ncbi:MAG: AraC family transcriptional regulator [Agathobacter sp.]|nr:AraC family transcriptional regulator [Agathobacter sp.]MDY3889394.1 AraC family transcriptional regulator [Agathobacter sp.]
MKNKNYGASSYSFSESTSRHFSSGKYYLILYIAKGTCHFKVDDEWKYCSTEDMVVIKPGNRTSMTFRGGRHQLEILELRVLPEYLETLSDESTNLLEAFQFVPYEIRVLRVGSNLSMLIKNITLNLVAISFDDKEFGNHLYEKNLVTMALILTVRACIEADQVYRSNKRRHLLMDDVFRYIHMHLTEDLTLEQLEKEFYISRYHICREFKKMTGQTPHAYIVKARLDLCCKYIEQGIPIREVYEKGGFGGYNHFFRAFKKEYHMTPMEYYKNYK